MTALDVQHVEITLGVRSTCSHSLVRTLLRSLTCLVLSGLSLNLLASRVAGDELMIGASSISITPQLPVALSGQMRTRIARNVESPVTATALALESRDGTRMLEQAIFVSCDLVNIPQEVRDGVREKLKGQASDFDLTKLILSATHTHTAPVMRNDQYEIPAEVMQPPAYIEFLTQQLAHVAAAAWAKRAPGAVGWGLGHAVVAYNRRVTFTDGSAAMYGNTNRPNFHALEDTEDHGVEVLFFWDKDQKLIATAINVACPSQVVEGRSAVNADFWHEVRELLQARHGKDVLVLGWTGAAGDQSPRPMFRKSAEERMQKLRGLTPLSEAAHRILQAWEEAYAGARQEIHSNAVLSHKTETIDLPQRLITTDEYAQAQSRIAAVAKEPDNRWRLRWHGSVMERYQQQQAGKAQPYQMELHVLRIGDIGIATNDFELFTAYGIQMKARSPALQTFVIQLAGPGTYLPTAKAIAGGGYSAIPESNLVGPEGGKVLVDRTVELLHELWPK